MECRQWVMGWTPPTASMCQDGGVDQPSERRRRCRKLPRLVWISQSRFFMRTARMRRARWCYSHTGSQQSPSLHQKPDRWQHPTSVSDHSKNHLRRKGASTDGKRALGAARAAREICQTIDIATMLGALVMLRGRQSRSARCPPPRRVVNCLSNVERSDSLL
jgi:hypothetical protein